MSTIIIARQGEPSDKPGFFSVDIVTPHIVCSIYSTERYERSNEDGEPTVIYREVYSEKGSQLVALLRDTYSEDGGLWCGTELIPYPGTIVRWEDSTNAQ